MKLRYRFSADSGSLFARSFECWQWLNARQKLPSDNVSDPIFRLGSLHPIIFIFLSRSWKRHPCWQGWRENPFPPWGSQQPISIPLFYFSVTRFIELWHREIPNPNPQRKRCFNVLTEAEAWITDIACWSTWPKPSNILVPTDRQPTLGAFPDPVLFPGTFSHWELGFGTPVRAVVVPWRCLNGDREGAV